MIAGTRRIEDRLGHMFGGDFDIPEFMNPKRTICAEVGCVKRALENATKCLDCTLKEEIPEMHDAVVAILKAKK